MRSERVQRVVTTTHGPNLGGLNLGSNPEPTPHGLNLGSNPKPTPHGPNLGSTPRA